MHLAARVAYDTLMKSEPWVVKRAEHMLSGLSSFTTFERDHPFVECATFADEIKEQGFDDQSHWHFVDTPFFDHNFTKPDWYPQMYNVTWALVRAI